jgi:hypothetical protein
MRDENCEDARAIWQRQCTRSSSLTAHELSEKARQVRIKRRKEWLGNSALALIALGTASHGMLHTSAPGWRLVFAICIAWAASGWLLSRGVDRRASSPPALTPTDGLSFYRQELEGRQHLFRRFLPSFFAPAVLAMSSWILMVSGVARKLHVRVTFVPLCTLLGFWILGIFILRMRTRKELKEELAELASLECEDNQDT